MGIEGVMVSYNHSGPEENANIITVSASGIKFSDRWVLTHGSLLSPLDIANDIHNLKGKPILNEKFYNNIPEMYITCERPKFYKESSAEKQLNDLELASRMRDNPSKIELEHKSYQVRVLTGRVCHIWQCPVLDDCVDEILYSWIIGHRDRDMEKQGDLGKTLISVFVLIDLENNIIDRRQALRPLSELLDLIFEPPERGGRIQIHSTPFGCEAFLNSATRGWICGRVGSKPSLLLTDASSALGSEGAPVYNDDVTNNQSLFGMVISSVSWWKGEWVGLTLVAPLATVLRSKLRIQQVTNKNSLTNTPALKRLLENIDSSTVLVRCGEMWGSGVYLGAGYILTCAHVVTGRSEKQLSIYCGGVEETALLKYKTSKDKAYDLALLYTNPDRWLHLTPVQFAVSEPVKGEPVIAVGYPYFNERQISDLRPTITSGYINNTSPSMIQTSCCVQSGFSGGPIFRLRQNTNGHMENSKGLEVELVGITVSNAKTQKANVCYPFVNMSIPVKAFEGYLNDYFKSKDVEILKNIEIKKEIVQSQWKLHPYRSKI